MTNVEPDIRNELTALLPNLRAFSNSLTRNRDLADDLVQETLIKAWKNQDRFIPGSNLKAWLFTILRNTYLTHLRRRKFEAEDVNGELVQQLSVEASQGAHMDLIDFSEALARLPREQREAILLVGAEGFSHEDAALMCGCAVGTMKSRVNRARNKLSEILGLQDADGGESSSLSATITQHLVQP